MCLLKGFLSLNRVSFHKSRKVEKDKDVKMSKNHSNDPDSKFEQSEPISTHFSIDIWQQRTIESLKVEICGVISVKSNVNGASPRQREPWAIYCSQWERSTRFSEVLITSIYWKNQINWVVARRHYKRKQEKTVTKWNSGCKTPRWLCMNEHSCDTHQRKRFCLEVHWHS